MNEELNLASSEVSNEACVLMVSGLIIVAAVSVGVLAAVTYRGIKAAVELAKQTRYAHAASKAKAIRYRIL